MSLDETDRQILDLLKTDGRMSYREIAEETGVTPPTVKSRIDDMKEEGIIKQFTVDIDKEATIHGTLIDAMIDLATSPGDTQEVVGALEDEDTVESVDVTTDLSIVARFQGKKEELNAVLDSLPDGVQGARTRLLR